MSEAWSVHFSRLCRGYEAYGMSLDFVFAIFNDAMPVPP